MTGTQILTDHQPPDDFTHAERKERFLALCKEVNDQGTMLSWMAEHYGSASDVLLDKAIHIHCNSSIDDREIDDKALISEGDYGVWVAGWFWVRYADLWDGDLDTDGQPCNTTNHYHCEVCDESWEDTWSCGCDDECPTCGDAISPHESITTPLY
jgi:hypothetical protein